jgi:NosR/NirI family nitrous oxide reductase transcriptional regulator
MRNKYFKFILLLVISLVTINTFAQRFPAPEFDVNYKIPETQVSDVKPIFYEILDIVVFLGALALMTWVIIKKRSRKAVFWISVFSLLYFGFYREGCICAIGSIQNVTMAIFNPAYTIPLTAIIFFIAPLAVTLFYGRTFCAGVCPLGAIQDLVAFRPISLKSWVRTLLGLIPVLYLGLALLFAATGTDFIICRYDPFVGFFRMNGTFMMLGIGALLLLVGIFIARPYCRFFCPYGVLLNLVSRVSNKHMSIANGKCISCKLCENACPFDAIDKPTGLEVKNDNRRLVKKIIVYGFITPLLVVVIGWVTSKYHEDFAKVNFKVSLAEKMIQHNNDSDKDIEPLTEVTTFEASGTPVEALYREAAKIVNQFYIGSWIIGGLIGLVFSLTLAKLTIYPYRDDYTANKGNCFSCARCIDYCPVK